MASPCVIVGYSLVIAALTGIARAQAITPSERPAALDSNQSEGDASSDGDAAVEVFDFFGFRASVPSVEDKVLLSLTAEAILDDLNGDDIGEKLVRWASVYDGVIWGKDLDNVAAMWYPLSRIDADQRWRRYHESFNVPELFPPPARFLGRTQTFGWDGMGGVGLRVRLCSDRVRPGFWTEVSIVEHLFGLASDPMAAMRRIMQPTENPQFSESIERLDEYEGWRRFDWSSDSSRVTCWLEPRDSSHWERERVLAIKNLRNSRTILYHLTFRSAPDDVRHLPSHPGEIINSNRDLQGISSITVEDFTGLGRWEEGIIVAPTSTPSQRMNGVPSYGRLSGTAIAGLLLACVLFRQHVRYLYGLTCTH